MTCRECDRRTGHKMDCGQQGGFDPRTNGEYLRKRFSEAIWESRLMNGLKHVDPDVLDPMVDRLVERLLTEAGIQW